MLRRKDGAVDPVPSKRIFYSIITDYDLNRAMCELVDNAIDEWVRGGRRHKLEVEIDFDMQQKSMEIRDNAGGVAREEIEILIGPGHSSSSPEPSAIGYFGVGTKRAVVALAQDIVFKTARPGRPTYELGIDDEWIAHDSWLLDVFEVDPISGGSTYISLHRLRVELDEETIERLRGHLSETYARFLRDGRVTIRVDGKAIAPVDFERWAYPPDYSPRRFYGDLHLAGGRSVAVEAIVGLSDSSSPATGDYGLFCYCNDRLVARAVKTHHVGFDKGNIGVAHPDLSIMRCIVGLRGDTQDMPWNSSKSGINYNHRVFIALRRWLIDRMKEYAAVSRRLASGAQWQEQVFRHTAGSIDEIFVEDFPTAKKNYLPPLPKRTTAMMTPPCGQPRGHRREAVDARPARRAFRASASNGRAAARREPYRADRSRLCS